MLPYQGDRLVLVCYTPRCLHRLPSEDLCYLESLGFPLPAASDSSLCSVDVRPRLDCVGDHVEHEVEDYHPSEGHAVLVRAQDMESLEGYAVFLSHVITAERRAVLDVIRDTEDDPSPFVSALAGFERELQSLEKELTLMSVAEALDDDSPSGFDGCRLARARAAMLEACSGPWSGVASMQASVSAPACPERKGLPASENHRPADR